MARMQPKEARGKLRKRELDQWLNLIRNPEFQSDLCEWKRQAREGQPIAPPKPKGRYVLTEGLDFVPGPMDRLYALEKKWGFHHIPFRAILHPDIPGLEPKTVELYENFIEGDIFLGPVLVYDHRAVPRRILLDRLTFCVDLSSAPVEVVLGLIEGKLREARKKLAVKGDLKTKGKHLSKGPLYRRVFDEYAAGQSYSAIAKTLGLPKSTVQSAYNKAKVLIGGSAPVTRWWQKVKNGPRHCLAIDSVSFDIDKHFAECSVCRNVERWDQHCEIFKSWATTNLGPTYVPFEDMRPDGSLRDSFSADEEFS